MLCQLTVVMVREAVAVPTTAIPTIAIPTTVIPTIAIPTTVIPTTGQWA